MFLSEYFLFNMVNLGIKTFTKIFFKENYIFKKEVL